MLTLFRNPFFVPRRLSIVSVDDYSASAVLMIDVVKLDLSLAGPQAEEQGHADGARRRGERLLHLPPVVITTGMLGPVHFAVIVLADENRPAGGAGPSRW
jgi:hypothetical protein